MHFIDTIEFQLLSNARTFTFNVLKYNHFFTYQRIIDLSYLRAVPCERYTERRKNVCTCVRGKNNPLGSDEIKYVIRRRTETFVKLNRFHSSAVDSIICIALTMPRCLVFRKRVYTKRTSEHVSLIEFQEIKSEQEREREREK